MPQPSPLEIRPATEADREAIAEVAASGVATLRRWYRPTAEARSRKRALEVSLSRIVACAAGRVIGTVQFRVDESRLHLMGLDVLETHRCRGVATRLVDHLAGIAKEQRLAALSLYTIRETGNERIFTKMGFVTRREGPTTDFESDRVEVLTEIYMERDVGP